MYCPADGDQPLLLELVKYNWKSCRHKESPLLQCQSDLYILSVCRLSVLREYFPIINNTLTRIYVHVCLLFLGMGFEITKSNNISWEEFTNIFLPTNLFVVNFFMSHLLIPSSYKSQIYQLVCLFLVVILKVCVCLCACMRLCIHILILS